MHLHHSQVLRLQKKTLSVFSVSLIVFCLSVSFFSLYRAEAAGTTYYVSNCGTIGNDSNNGTSTSTPWLTVAKVNASVFNPGDSILFNSGCTWRGSLTVPSSGTAGNPIVFGAYGTGTPPTFLGSTNLESASWTLAASSSVFATGTVRFSNLRLSIATNTPAFIDFSSSSALTSYLGDQITLTDSGGHHLTGYIKATGTGQTYGSQLLSNTTLNTTSSIIAFANVSLGIATGSGYPTGSSTLQITLTSGGGNAAQSFSAPAGAALLSSAYLKNGTEVGGVYIGDENSAITMLNEIGNISASWTQCSFYVTNTTTTTNYQIYQGTTASDTSLFNSASAVQVLTPSNTGVTVVTSPGGSTYGWASEDAGFNRDDASGYTYSISVPTANVWYASPVATPVLSLIFNGGTSIGTPEMSLGNVLTQGEFYYGSSTLYLYSSSSPSTYYSAIEGAQNHVINVAHNYITMSGIRALYGAVGVNVQADAIHDVTINNVTSEYNAEQGLLMANVMNETTTASYNLNVNSSTFDYNGGHGIHFLWKVTSSTAAGNTVIGNGMIPGATGWHGISTYGAFGTTAQPTYITITRNLVANTVYTDAGAEGTGIQCDGNCSLETISYNTVYGNGGWGIALATPSWNNSVFGNVVYNNGVGPGSSDSGMIVNNSYGNVIYGNTIYGNPNGGLMIMQSSSINNTVENNILMDNGSTELWMNPADAGFVSNYNDIYHTAGGSSYMNWNGATYNLAGWQTVSGQDANSINKNPQFISTSTNNFALQSSSSAIDAGMNFGSTYEMGLDPASTWPSNVILDNQNNYGSGWDIGAYIYTQTSTPSIVMTAPMASSTVSGTVTISASSTAVSPASISSVQFYLDGSPLGSPVTSTSSPNIYSYSWNTTGATNASHTLYALATDNYGNTASSSPVAFTVYNAPPPPSGGSGGGGEPQSAFIIVPAATSTASSTTTSTSPTTSSIVSSFTSSSTSSLQAELDSLLAELHALEARARASSSSVPSSYLFTTNLQIWDEGSEAHALQLYLIAKDTGPAVQKLKIHGTTYTFGMLTYNALVEFQASVGIHATGYFGPITRAWVNGHE